MSVHVNRLTALPVNDGPDCCPACWALPGRDHGLSCPTTTPEQPFWLWLLHELRPLFELVGIVTVCLLLWAIVLAPIALLIWS